MGFENPFRNKSKKEVAAAAGLAALGAAGIALNAQGLADGDRIGREMHDALNLQKSQEMQIGAEEMKSMQEKGPGGATISINPETGQAVVDIPSPEERTVTMRPPGGGETKTIDPTTRQVEIDIKSRDVEISPKGRDISFPPPAP